MFVRSRMLVLVASACLASAAWSFAGAEQGQSAAEQGQSALPPSAGQGQVQQGDPSSGQGGESIVIIPQQGTQSYSDAELRSVAVALVAIDRIAHAYLPSLEAAATPEDEDRVREAAVGEATQAISNTGITVDKYNEILLVARNDPQVADRIKTQLENLPADETPAGGGSPAQGGAGGDQNIPANPAKVPADETIH